MATRTLGIIMNGVTGRMGLNQHLVRSILAIRDQGGVALPNGDRVMPDPILVGRNAEKIAALARQYGIARSTTDLPAALKNPDDTVFFDAATTQMRADLVTQAIEAGKHVYCEKPVADALDKAIAIAKLAKQRGVKNGVPTFEEVTEAAGLAPLTMKAPHVEIQDFDNDGWPDIYVACDSAPSLLYRNNHDGTFREIAVPAGCGLDENGVALSGMGVAVADYDGDGWLDIARTNFSEQVTTLYRNYGNGAFEDASIKAGLGVNRKYLGFGVGFVDFNNDGWKDLFLANGHVYSQIANRKLHITYRQPKVLYRNLGNGRFQDVSFEAGKAIRAENLARGCAFGDFDNDGDVDVVINNLDGPPTLLRNDGGNRNNWMIVKCVGTRSNRSAIGTRVRVTSGERSQIDEVMSGSSYYSQNGLRLHFGLGKANKVDDLAIAWPSGLKETFKHLPVNQFNALGDLEVSVSAVRHSNENHFGLAAQVFLRDEGGIFYIFVGIKHPRAFKTQNLA